MGCEQRFGAQQTSKCICRSPLVELTLLLLKKGRKYIFTSFCCCTEETFNIFRRFCSTNPLSHFYSGLRSFFTWMWLLSIRKDVFTGRAIKPWHRLPLSWETLKTRLGVTLGLGGTRGSQGCPPASATLWSWHPTSLNLGGTSVHH